MIDLSLSSTDSSLEAATSRLEDLVPADGHGPALGVPSMASQTQSISKDADSMPQAIVEFDSIISTEVQTYVKMSEDIGGLVAEQVY